MTLWQEIDEYIKRPSVWQRWYDYRAGHVYTVNAWYRDGSFDTSRDDGKVDHWSPVHPLDVQVVNGWTKHGE